MASQNKIEITRKLFCWLTISNFLYIIVLLILAGVTIATLTGDNGLLQKAQISKEISIDAEIEEEIKLAWNKVYADSYQNSSTDIINAFFSELVKTGHTDENTKVTGSGTIIKIEKYRGKNKLLDISSGIISDPITVAKAKQNGTVFDDNTQLTDEYENTFIIPKGFKIASDSAEIITEGIVIEDVTYANTIGSQFVWIPVSKDDTETNKVKGKEAKNKTIFLGRYRFKKSGDDAGTVDQSRTDGGELTVTYPWGTCKFTEETQRNTESKNAVAKNIKDFIRYTNAAGGFWIGRYEARKKTITQGNSNVDIITEVKNDNVYNNITQPNAAIVAREMYDNDSYFESDLINSYAWDTATLFLQEYDNRTGNNLKPYSIQERIESEFKSTGTTTDIICNVYDMASNCFEWTTETCSISGKFRKSLRETRW